MLWAWCSSLKDKFHPQAALEAGVPQIGTTEARVVGVAAGLQRHGQNAQIGLAGKYLLRLRSKLWRDDHLDKLFGHCFRRGFIHDPVKSNDAAKGGRLEEAEAYTSQIQSIEKRAEMIRRAFLFSLLGGGLPEVPNGYCRQLEFLGVTEI